MLSPATLVDWEVCKVVTLGLEGVARIRGKMKTKEHSQKGKNEGLKRCGERRWGSEIWPISRALEKKEERDVSPVSSGRHRCRRPWPAGMGAAWMGVVLFMPDVKEGACHDEGDKFKL
ncbi:hypothetical protein DEO72_LG4g227 [Vigna unguiculata]|uniref:Uncharacterized protein n=1 Tax=Vigna unguiculata TaxID=3917 RepID=A0A4D6LLA4_VIGUN|nr:hypothetical protein DEO72_LG4g227 [Vigna unguiculata]